MPKRAAPLLQSHNEYRVRLPLRMGSARTTVKARVTNGWTETTMTTVTVADVDIALHRQPLMREFTPAQFEQLMDIAELVNFAPNEVIHREGDESDKLYLVVRGHVAIELAGRLEVLRVETVGAGRGVRLVVDAAGGGPLLPVARARRCPGPRVRRGGPAPDVRGRSAVRIRADDAAAGRRRRTAAGHPAADRRHALDARPSAPERSRDSSGPTEWRTAASVTRPGGRRSAA